MTNTAPVRISFSETCAYLGFRKVPSSGLAQQIRAGIRTAETLAHPRGIWKEISLTEISPPGRDAACRLTGCRRIVLLAVTIGQEAEQPLQRLRLTDLSAAVILDCALSAAVQAACEQLCGEIAATYAACGEALAPRFGPGYGDLPLSFQRELLDSLDAFRRIGLTATAEGLLFPRKSVTAMMGILEAGKEGSPLPSFGGCRNCPHYEACYIRKEGISCGK